MTRADRTITLLLTVAAMAGCSRRDRPPANSVASSPHAIASTPAVSVRLDSAWLPTAILDSSPNPDSAVRRIITLRNGRRIETRFEIRRFLGALPRSSGEPLLVFEGRPCTPCDAPLQIMLMSPSDWRFNSHPPAYAYPGVLKESTFGSERPTVDTDSIRLFLGPCSADTVPVLLWFRRTPEDGQIWRPHVDRVRVQADTLVEDTLAPNTALPDTVGGGSWGRCSEILGRDQFIL